MAKHAFYMMSNKPGGIFYHGATGSVGRRSAEHKGERVGGSAFCKKYGLDRLVYFEVFDTREEALQREWQVKRWRREWKLEMVSGFNPEWRDLSGDLMQILPWGLLKD